MQELLVWFNILAAGAVVGACMWAVMSPRVRDGVLIKSGLMLLALSAFALASALGQGALSAQMLAVVTLGNVGTLLVASGIALRWRRAGRVYRIDEWITPPTVVIRKPERPTPGGSTLEMEDAQRGSRL